MSERIEALAAIHAACWLQLAQAAHDRAHGWRRMGLATAPRATDGEAGWPEVRTVVLREVQAEQRQLVFYTDSRAAKVAQLQAQPQATALLWCPALGWQLRLRLRCAVDTGGLAVLSRWARLKLTPAAQDYLSPLTPGSAQGTAGAAPAPAHEDCGHFAVVFGQVLSMDWLELHPAGHRRARFDAQGQGTWLTP